MSRDGLPLLALCPGEPAGIGPDITVAAAARAYSARIACFADPDILRSRATALGLEIELATFANITEIPVHRPGTLAVIAVRRRNDVVPGTLDPANAAYVLECLDRAIDGSLRGSIDCIVTGPAHKGVINDAGFAFTGHTEYLADACPSRPRPVMLLATGDFRVALVTTHLALRDVPGQITPASVSYTIETLAKNLRERFAIENPRITVCGLNPHAGENGHFGSEDANIIAPAIASIATSSATVIGPVPADTAFTPALRRVTDAYVAMYHDQGLPVIKALAFGEIINITLGLPLLRTSVDHGTALDLAASGRARCASLEAALDEAVRLCTAGSA
jgi:4-hydroxythreonine-4-phosphate dehydrogenase